MGGGERGGGQREGGREGFAGEDRCGDLILIDSRINTGAALLILGRLLSPSKPRAHARTHTHAHSFFTCL